MEMLSGFTAVLHVPNLNRPEHLIAVLEESDAFGKREIAQIAKKIQGQKSVETFCCLLTIRFHEFNILLFI